MSYRFFHFSNFEQLADQPTNQPYSFAIPLKFSQKPKLQLFGKTEIPEGFRFEALVAKNYKKRINRSL